MAFPRPIRAVVFDMDGLLIDTERLARETWRQAAADCGVDLDDTLFASLIGRTRRDSGAILRERWGETFSIDAFRARCTTRWEACVAESGIPLKPGAAELLDYLDAIRMPRAVATSTGIAGAERSLALAGVIDRLPVVVTGEQVERGKPAPDIYLLAASRLGVDPARCLALEDSIYGMLAAHAAGMAAVMVPDLVEPTDEIAGLAYRVVDSLADVRALLEAAR